MLYSSHVNYITRYNFQLRYWKFKHSRWKLIRNHDVFFFRLPLKFQCIYTYSIFNALLFTNVLMFTYIVVFSQKCTIAMCVWKNPRQVFDIECLSCIVIFHVTCVTFFIWLELKASF